MKRSNLLMTGAKLASVALILISSSELRGQAALMARWHFTSQTFPVTPTVLTWVSGGTIANPSTQGLGTVNSGCGTGQTFFAVGPASVCPTAGGDATNCTANSAFRADQWNNVLNATEDYIQFSIGAALSNNPVTPTELTFSFKRDANNQGQPTGNGNSPQSYHVRYSTDNFSTFTSVETGSLGTSTTWNCISINLNFPLSFPALVNIAFGSPVTFRLYAYGGGTAALRIDDIRFLGESLLPVSWLSFNAVALETQVALSWSTATEENNALFSIDRSVDAVTFSEIGSVQGAGTSSNVNEYAFTDEQPLSGTSYYRVKQTDEDGTYTYSSVRKVSLSQVAGLEVTVSPNPATERVMIRISAPQDKCVLQIVDLRGRIVYDQQVDLQDGVNPVDVSLSSIPSGQYFTKVITSGGVHSSTLIIQ